MSFRPQYVRDRLALWYTVISSLILAAYICGATVLLSWHLTRELYYAAIQDMETVEGLLYFTADGQLAVHNKYFDHPNDQLILNRMLEVLTPDGKVAFRNEKLGTGDLGGEIFYGEGETGYSPRRALLKDGTHVLLISHIHYIQGKRFVIRLAYSTVWITTRVKHFLSYLLFALPIALCTSALAGFKIAGKALSPLRKMAIETERIAANRLHARIQIDNPDDELGYMARVLNDLLQRLEGSFERLKSFSSNVSHELRTPLASIRSIGEVGLRKVNTVEECKEVVGFMLEELDKLTYVVSTLLVMSKADAGQIELKKTSFSLIELLQEIIAMLGVLAEEKEQQLEIDGDERIYVCGDRTFLRQAVLNLIDNAIKYSPEKSFIYVRLRRSDARPQSLCEIVIEDQGPGIPMEYRSKIFDRYYRVDGAQLHEKEGIGLGLAIAKWVVEMHGGTIELKPSYESGCAFVISLPESAC